MNYWQKQTSEPLFPDLLWSRPETKRGAGKLLIIGGQAQEFSHVAAVYTAAEKAGAGTVRVIMPESTRKFTKMLPNIEYAPSNTSGSFAKAALGEFFEASEWADHVLLAGDLGKNSETTTVLDGYLLRCQAQTTIADNALRSIALPAEQLIRRPVALVLSQSNLQKLAVNLGLASPITSSTVSNKLAEILHEITNDKKGSIAAEHGGNLWASSEGKVFSRSIEKSTDQSVLAATIAVWVMQNPVKIFEAMATALFCINNDIYGAAGRT